MSVFFTLGLLASYQLLRHQQGRAVAAASCLLLGSSPSIFRFSTQLVFSDIPYFFASIVCLLFAVKMDSEPRAKSRKLFGLLFCVFLLLSLLIRTAAIALLFAIVAWLAASLLRNFKTAIPRLKSFLPALILGSMLLTAWMHWSGRHESLEWQLGGWPGSYLSQLQLKSGNNPELGKASLSDLPQRMENNMLGSAEAFAQLLLHKGWRWDWYSPGVFGTLLLLLVGLAYSMWRTGGGLLEWYFVCYLVMQLMWPWAVGMRFMLPVAPLACLYVWRGGEWLVRRFVEKPLKVAALGALVSIVLGIAAWRNVMASFGFWMVFTFLSTSIVLAAALRPAAVAQQLSHSSRQELRLFGISISPAQAAVASIVGLLCVVGIVRQLSIGRDNLHFDLAKSDYYAEIEAARWIRAHTSDTDVVMARKEDLVYHYSGHRVIWFPPISDPEVLMDGIQKFAIKWVVVTNNKYGDWKPSDQECFEALARAHPKDFHLTQKQAGFQIFQVLSEIGSP